MSFRNRTPPPPTPPFFFNFHVSVNKTGSNKQNKTTNKQTYRKQSLITASVSCSASPGCLITFPLVLHHVACNKHALFNYCPLPPLFGFQPLRFVLLSSLGVASLHPGSSFIPTRARLEVQPPPDLNLQQVAQAQKKTTQNKIQQRRTDNKCKASYPDGRRGVKRHRVSSGGNP